MSSHVRHGVVCAEEACKVLVTHNHDIGLPAACMLLVRDAEMTIKVIFERSSQKGGGGRGFEKRFDRGPILKFDCRAKAQEKQHFGKSHFYCRRFFPGNAVTIILGNYPPSTLQGVGLGGRKKSENYCRRKLLSFRRLLVRIYCSVRSSPGHLKPVI